MEKITLAKGLLSFGHSMEPKVFRNSFFFTCIKDPSGRYFVSILVEEELRPLPFLCKSVGVDLGLINTVITSDKQKERPSKFLRQSLKQLRQKQKTLSRRVKASANWIKAKKNVARLHAKIKDARIDFLHKISKKLIDENQVMTFETLHVKGMMKKPTFCSRNRRQ